MFKKPFSFKGRIRRTEFGLSYLIYFFGTMLTLGFGIVITLPFILAQAAKRSHDIGNSGWFILIPIYNPFFLLFAEGETESNEYGENPKLVSGQNNDAQKSKASGSEVIGNNKNTASQNPPSLNSPISNTNQVPPPTNQGPPPMKKEYYIQINGEQKGPLNMEKVKLLIELNQINSQSLIWEKSFTDWKSIKEVPEINNLFI
jgi:uncharacterized membrane protein YhaH (DUF805 family)